MADERAVEEVLEFIWAKGEEGADSIKELLCVDEVQRTGGDLETIKEMERDGLVTVNKDSVSLTEKGAVLAKGVVRRHRLAERLLADVLDVHDEETLERHACSFEHSLSAAVADSICTLLGHPPSCPHGLPIPKGECCTRGAERIRPLVLPLLDIDAGESVRIAFIAPKTFKRIEKLGSMGLVPGSVIKLVQKRPAYVIKLAETTVAIEEDIAADIFVKQLR
ncbi:MAG: metal-dependent transcriptional regulator [Deltaproteobacteria bacterium]|nr:metal-dependent transcriptional regulator [Deltaproteobacteria bacterium]